MVSLNKGEAVETCKTCRWWLPNAHDIPAGGICDLASTTVAAKSKPIFADGAEAFASARGQSAYLHTGPDFGCIHHEEDLRHQDMAHTPSQSGLSQQVIEAEIRRVKEQGMPILPPQQG